VAQMSKGVSKSGHVRFQDIISWGRTGHAIVREQVMRPSVRLGFFDRSVPAGSHICAFYSDPVTRDEVVMPFLAQGLRSGDKCICVLASLGPEEVLTRLGRQVDLDLSVERGQLELATPADAYLRTGTFVPDDMLSFWKEAAVAAEAAASGLVRAAGEMPRELDADGRRQFIHYEARLTEFAADLPELILCLYDLRLSGADMLMDVLRTHPVVIVDGMLHDNPYYVPHDTLLGGAGVIDGGPDA
jgi:MEDS: MEthanogen/methylotroph, DcmR Sensory domain